MLRPLKRWWNLLRLDPVRNPYAERSAKKLFWLSINGDRPPHCKYCGWSR